MKKLSILLSVLIIGSIIYGSIVIFSPYMKLTRMRISNNLKKRDMKEFDIKKLKEGGYVIFMRHTSRDKAWKNQVIEIEKLSLIDLKGECVPGSQLNSKGQDELKKIQKKIIELPIPIGEVYASPTCRTQQMAKILFGKNYTTTDGLYYYYLRDPTKHKYYNDKLRDLILRPVPEGQNRLLLSHNSLLGRKIVNFDLSLKQGEAAIFKPLPNPSGELNKNFLGTVRKGQWMSMLGL